MTEYFFANTNLNYESKILSRIPNSKPWILLWTYFNYKLIYFKNEIIQSSNIFIKGKPNTPYKNK